MSQGGHLHDELSQNQARVTVETTFGPVTGGRASNGAVVFLEIPYALPPGRFEDPIALPKGYRYEVKDYVYESAYAVQPSNDGQAQGIPPVDKLGYGEPSENPLFLNIVSPPSFPDKRGFPVKIYIHGGFLQFGSPHSLGSQAQYVAAERSEVWVNIGYRLSAFGFLAADKPRLSGNYGFKDQWLALQWVKANISEFGGNPEDIQVTGLSAGAHSVHQILHHASSLPDGVQAPFRSAILQSNAILANPKSSSELQSQFNALCEALLLDPTSPDILSVLKDPVKTPWESITRVIETDDTGRFGTFRGCLSDDWIPISPAPMEWQRSGELARGLKAHGVRSVVVGDLSEEWYLYSIAHPINGPQDIVPNLERYFPADMARNFMKAFPPLPPDAGSEQALRRYGDIMSSGQVHLPVRLLAQDLLAAGLPVVRYEIRWTPEQHRPFGYVTHGCDRLLWALRSPALESQQFEVAKAWLDRFAEETDKLDWPGHDVQQILVLMADRSIGWTLDNRWDELMKLQSVLSPSQEST